MSTSTPTSVAEPVFDAPAFVPAETTETAAPAEPKQHKKGTILFTAIKDADETLVPQAAQIVKILREAGAPVAKKELVEQIKSKVPNSKQPPGRILSFYKARLVKEGYVDVQKAA